MPNSVIRSPSFQEELHRSCVTTPLQPHADLECSIGQYQILYTTSQDMNQGLAGLASIVQTTCFASPALLLLCPTGLQGLQFYRPKETPWRTAELLCSAADDDTPQRAAAARIHSGAYNWSSHKYASNSVLLKGALTVGGMQLNSVGTPYVSYFGCALRV